MFVDFFVSLVKWVEIAIYFTRILMAEICPKRSRVPRRLVDALLIADHGMPKRELLLVAL